MTSTTDDSFVGTLATSDIVNLDEILEYEEGSET